MTVTLQEITAWQDTQLRWKQWVDGSDQLIKVFLEPEDAVEAGRVVERCRLTQFEAEVWNSLNQADPSERKALCKAAFESLNKETWKVKVDPSKSVPALWHAAQEMMKGQKAAK